MIGNLTLCLNGNELNIPIELSDEQIHAICASVNSETPLTGWEAPAEGDTFYYCDALNRVQSVSFTREAEMLADTLLKSANCFSSEIIAENIARADTLLRRLRRMAAVGRDPAASNHDDGYTILYNYQSSCLEVGMTGGCMALGDIVFSTEEQARDAISNNAAELIWYFTEMRDHV